MSQVFPTIENETAVDIGSRSWVIDVKISTSAVKTFWGENGVHPQMPSLENRTFFTKSTFGVWVMGFTVQPGGLLSVDSNGSIPLSYNGSLVTEGATIVDDDLFA
jgi:hypothetical protein